MTVATDLARAFARDTPPVLILVAGPSCAGKTTVAERLAADLCLPMVSKDMIKESLSDNMGWSDREWSRSLGGPSMELLILFAEMSSRSTPLASGRTI